MPFDLGNLFANAIFLIFFRIFIEIGNLILQFSLLLLNWVLSDGFIPWPYTNPIGNPIIDIGWTLTRDLANMSFVIILVAIGLGTALKLGEYQVQKTLPTLVIVALLINFTPVLLGLMIDGSNITMNFFLEKVSGLDAWGRASESQSALIIQTLQSGGAVLALIPAIFQTIMLFIINLLSAAIIIAFAGLFLIRHIAIWILVILSPIVFASYILPKTKKMYWDNWWNQFTQWTIIGIPAAFFLYLGNHIMIAAPSMNLNPPSSAIWDMTFLNFIRSVMPYAIALIFLWFGFFTALTSSAMGASEVINRVNDVKTRVTKLPKSRRAQWLKGKTAGAGLATFGATSRMAERLDQGAGKVKFVGRGLQIATKPMAWALRSADRAAMPSLIGYAAATRETPLPKQWNSMSDKEKERYISYQGLSQDRISLASKMIADKTFKNTSAAFQEKILSDAQKQAGNIHLKKQIEDIINFAPDKITKKMILDFELAGLSGKQKTDKKAEIEKKIKELIDSEKLVDNEVQAMAQRGETVRFDLINGRSVPILDEATKARVADEAARILQMKKLSPQDIEKISKGSLDTNAFRIATQNMTGSHFQKLLDIHGKDTIDAVMNGKNGLNTIIDSKDKLEDFYLKNPNLVNFFAKSPAGQALDWAGLTYAGTNQQYDQLKDKMKIIRKFSDPVDRNLALEYSRRLERAISVTQEINDLRANSPTSPDIARLVTEQGEITRELRDSETRINASPNPELRRVARDLENIRNVTAPTSTPRAPRRSAPGPAPAVPTPPSPGTPPTPPGP